MASGSYFRGTLGSGLGKVASGLVKPEACLPVSPQSSWERARRSLLYPLGVGGRPAWLRWGLGYLRTWLAPSSLRRAPGAPLSPHLDSLPLRLVPAVSFPPTIHPTYHTLTFLKCKYDCIISSLKPPLLLHSAILAYRSGPLSSGPPSTPRTLGPLIPAQTPHLPSSRPAHIGSPPWLSTRLDVPLPWSLQGDSPAEDRLLPSKSPRTSHLSGLSFSSLEAFEDLCRLPCRSGSVLMTG